VQLTFDSDVEAFRAEFSAFLDENLPPASETLERPRSVSHMPAWARRWQRLLFDNGWLLPSQPPEFGGRNATVVQQFVYLEELSRRRIYHSFNPQGVNIVGASLLSFGSDEQKRRWAVPILRAEITASLGMSEPSAGSDLASLRTRAVRDGDHFIVNGQKVWTSGAHHSDFGILVVRTDPNAAKHAGLTFFYLDMKSPGVEVRPIKQISGESNFNEVFFTDVRIPDSQRLGKIGEGWKVSLTTLMNERLAVGDAPGPDFEDIFELTRSLELDDGPAIANSAVREKLAHWYIQAQGLKLTKFRTMTALSRGQTPGPESSITKVVSASKLQDIASFGMDLMGQAGSITDPAQAPMQGWFQEALLYAPGLRIAGGTDEVLRNIIAERVLGLPGDVRVDKDLPYNKIPTGRG
jgi:alkylation response protein AidB-like acyl-CoA dehydrogenase